MEENEERLRKCVPQGEDGFSGIWKEHKHAKKPDDRPSQPKTGRFAGTGCAEESSANEASAQLDSNACSDGKICPAREIILPSICDLRRPELALSSKYDLPLLNLTMPANCFEKEPEATCNRQASNLKIQPLEQNADGSEIPRSAGVERSSTGPLCAPKAEAVNQEAHLAPQPMHTKIEQIAASPSADAIIRFDSNTNRDKQTSARPSLAQQAGASLHNTSAPASEIPTTGLLPSDLSADCSRRPSNTPVNESLPEPLCDRKDERAKQQANPAPQRTQTMIEQIAASPAAGAVVQYESNDTYRKNKICPPVLPAKYDTPAPAPLCDPKGEGANQQANLAPQPRQTMIGQIVASPAAGAAVQYESNDTHRENRICPPVLPAKPDTPTPATLCDPKGEGANLQANLAPQPRQTMIEQIAANPAAGAVVQYKSSDSYRENMICPPVLPEKYDTPAPAPIAGASLNKSGLEQTTASPAAAAVLQNESHDSYRDSKICPPALPSTYDVPKPEQAVSPICNTPHPDLAAKAENVLQNPGFATSAGQVMTATLPVDSYPNVSRGSANIPTETYASSASKAPAQTSSSETTNAPVENRGTTNATAAASSRKDICDQHDPFSNWQNSSDFKPVQAIIKQLEDKRAGDFGSGVRELDLYNRTLKQATLDGVLQAGLNGFNRGSEKQFSNVAKASEPLNTEIVSRFPLSPESYPQESRELPQQKNVLTGSLFRMADTGAFIEQSARAIVAAGKISSWLSSESRTDIQPVASILPVSGQTNTSSSTLLASSGHALLTSGQALVGARQLILAADFRIADATGPAKSAISILPDLSSTQAIQTGRPTPDGTLIGRAISSAVPQRGEIAGTRTQSEAVRSGEFIPLRIPSTNLGSAQTGVPEARRAAGGLRSDSKSLCLPGIEIVIGALLTSTAIAKVRHGAQGKELAFSVQQSGNLCETAIQRSFQSGTKQDMANLKADVLRMNTQESHEKLQEKSINMNALLLALELFNQRLNFAPVVTGAAKDLSPTKESQQQQSLQKPGTTQVRQKYTIKEGDSLQVIAELLYYDRSVACLLADLNRHRIKESIIDGQRVVELFLGQTIELPQASEVELFLKERASKFSESKRVITILSNPGVHAAIAQEILGKIV